MLFELVYSSLARKGFGKKDLNELVLQSQANNEKNDITGCLFYKNSKFIQILEGEEEAVKELYAKIFKDQRHSHVYVIWKKETTERSFKDWSMAVYDLDSFKLNGGRKYVKEFDHKFDIEEIKTNKSEAKRLFYFTSKML